MKKHLTLTALFLIVLTFLSVPSVSASSGEIEAVRKPLETYLKNHIKGNSKKLGSAMHTVGKLMFIRDGKYVAVDFPRYLTGWKTRPADYQAKSTPYIDSIEVTGNVAIARLGLNYPGRRFTDYMTLMKIDGEWKITNKIAYSVRDPRNNIAETADMKKLRVPLENYLMGHKTGKAEYMKKAFHTEGQLMSMRNGEFTTTEFDKLFTYFKGKPADDENLRKRWIERIDVSEYFL